MMTKSTTNLHDFAQQLQQLGRIGNGNQAGYETPGPQVEAVAIRGAGTG